MRLAFHASADGHAEYVSVDRRRRVPVHRASELGGIASHASGSAGRPALPGGRACRAPDIRPAGERPPAPIRTVAIASFGEVERAARPQVLTIWSLKASAVRPVRVIRATEPSRRSGTSGAAGPPAPIDSRGPRPVPRQAQARAHAGHPPSSLPVLAEPPHRPGVRRAREAAGIRFGPVGNLDSHDQVVAHLGVSSSADLVTGPSVAPAALPRDYFARNAGLPTPRKYLSTSWRGLQRPGTSRNPLLAGTSWRPARSSNWHPFWVVPDRLSSARRTCIAFAALRSFSHALATAYLPSWSQLQDLS